MVLLFAFLTKSHLITLADLRDLVSLASLLLTAGAWSRVLIESSSAVKIFLMSVVSHVSTIGSDLKIIQRVASLGF